MTDALPAGIHVSGDAAGPAVVLLHSSQSNTGQWRDLIKRLQADYYLIGIDLLGYGKAPAPEVDATEAFRFTDEVPRIVAAVEQLTQGQPLILVGHSYGAAVALKLALENLLPVRALALFEPVAFHVLDANDPARQEVEAIANQMDQDDKWAATQAFVDYWNVPGYFAALPEKLQQQMASQADKVAMDFAALMGEPHKLVDYRRVEVPVLLLTGARTQASARRVAEQLQQVLPQVEVEQLACGHMGPLTHPQLVNPLLVNFLQQVTEPSGA
ncbi:alpha/beta fold hydrolase [Pseudidiomarina sp. 1APP75-27a]|uniref:alpha/beta fold hydrolase n=1 Tax=Pseudidiomarina terrestris TaxID=2820060 RepID=UPI002B05285A|nr:alpha/beta fold hydrolase [Pseudidiomarina sp. 1APP75-27a]MEA3587344.1 alpha/beta fold hydrolase [Pseudidiomarina sp. 1APP75-27a]